MHTIPSDNITWSVMRGDACDDFFFSYCADGDGMLQLVDYGDRVELQDQLEVVKTYHHADTLAMLNEAEKYLAATYPELFQLAKHTK